MVCRHTLCTGTPVEYRENKQTQRFKTGVNLTTAYAFPSRAAAFTSQVFAEQVVNLIGTDEISPPLEFANFTFTSWSEVSQVCGDSRVWGGMHFAVSIHRDV